jgi:hypothetical protein
MNEKIARAALAARAACHDQNYLVSIPEDHDLWADIASAVVAAYSEAENVTREESRKACGLAIMRCMNWKDSPGKWIAAFSILDSLHGTGARVVPVEATEEMIAAGQTEWRIFRQLTSAWRAMSAAGDLTNPLESNT